MKIRVGLSFHLSWLFIAFAAFLQGGGVAPTFSKVFMPDTIGPGSSSLLRFQIDNPFPNPTENLAFMDNLPAGLVVADTGLAGNTCAGTVTATPGGGMIELTGGQVAANTSCIIDVHVTATATGTLMNVSGDLTSDAGNSGPASDDLMVLTDLMGFSKAFSPASVPFGARSTLTFMVDNSLNASGISNIRFSDNLPVGVVIADPANALTDCGGGVFNAVPGSGFFSYTPAFSGDGSLAAGAVCTVSVEVRAQGVGILDNVSDELTATIPFFSESGGVATASLQVSADTVGIEKQFTDDPVPPGGTVTLEFTINNRDRDLQAVNVGFTDDLDAVLTGLVATGLPVGDVCGSGSLLSGSSTVTLSGATVDAQSSCTFSLTLQVPAGAVPAAYPNISSSLTGDLGGGSFESSEAQDKLFVTGAPVLSKTFLTNPVGAGQTTTIEFTIVNGTDDSVSQIAFTDNLSAFLSGAAVTASPAVGFCGPGAIAATFLDAGQLSLSVFNGSLAANTSCTFQVDILIPAGTAGSFLNTTGNITAVVDAMMPMASSLGQALVAPGTPQTGNSASATLVVVGGPLLTKSFTDDPVNAGQTVTLEFMLAHDAAAPADATGITFTDDLNAVIAGLAAVGLPMNDVCGAGSQISGSGNLAFTGGTLAPGASCTFAVTVQVPGGSVPGNFLNTTSSVTSTVSGQVTTSSAASDTLIIGGVEFTKAFVSDPVPPGDLVTLEFTISNNSAADITNFTFSDSLSAVLSGLMVEGALPSEPCGMGSSIVGTTNLSFSGGNLLAGTSCTFSVNLRVPGGAPNGDFPNLTTSQVFTINGQTAFPAAATDLLSVTSELLSISKSFTDDPVTPGSTVNLEFTVTNLSPSSQATAITFTDDLNGALAGLAAVGLPANDVCGAGSQLSGAGVLTLTGGTLAPGASCAFSATLQVPAVVPAGPITNTTSTVAGQINGLSVSGPAASDNLLVGELFLSKQFLSAAVPGGTVTLRLTIDNVSSSVTASGLDFTDDLDAVLSGLTATGLPLSDICGAGSQISGTSLLTFSNGFLGPMGSCSVDVLLQVPAGAVPGTFPNATSTLTQSGLFAADPGTDSLVIEPPPTFAKAFSSPVTIIGGTVSLTFTIDNGASSLAATGLDFTDILPGGLVVASIPNASTTCTGGTLTAVGGSGNISYSGGTVGAGASCTVSVNVTGASAGVQDNVSGDLTSSSGNSGTASDSITVNPPPVFLKVFSPNPVTVGAISTLTLTIDNSGSTVSATGLDFTDDLPAGLVVASTPNASTTCTGGTLTAVAGSGQISYSAGTVAAGAACTVAVDVAANNAGALANTTDNLTSNLGVSGTASDTLVVNAPPGFSKSFSPDTILVGELSTLTLTIDNSSSTVAATGLDFTDTLPANVEVASPPNASTTCTGGTLTAVAGGSQISYSGGTVAAGATCTVQADVVGVSGSVEDNVTGDLTSSLGSSGSARATITVNGSPLFSKSFAPDPIIIGGVSTLTFTIENSASAAAATGLDFTDDLPAGLVAATPANASTTCAGGTLTAVDGSAQISYTGGTLAASASCTVQVDVTGVSAGVQNNVSGDLTSSLGNSGTASASLTVNPPPIFAKSFSPNPIPQFTDTSLTFTIDNSASTAAASGLDFTDDLPAGVTVAAAANASTTCTGGTVTAVGGTTQISYSGGTVAAAASCTVQVDVTGNDPGMHLNVSGNLTSSLGDSGTASDTLTVNAPTVFTKTFSTPAAVVGQAFTLLFTIDNSTSTVAATGLSFVDNLPTGMTVADPANASTDCTGGTLTAVPGSGQVSYSGGSVAAMSICTVQVDVVSSIASPLTNTTEELSSSLGSSGTASADVLVIRGGEVQEIPVLGPWGIVGLAGLLMAFAWRRLSKRKVT